MTTLGDWPLAPLLRTERLSLEPLRVEHADEMAPLLNDPQLHVFTGDTPRTLEEMRSRYEQQVKVFSVDASERWVNWIVRERGGGEAVGGLQAIVRVEGEALVAELAWIIGARYQRRGYAREAAGAMVAWLRERGPLILVADIHAENVASMKLAGALGFTRSGELGEAGDVRWTA